MHDLTGKTALITGATGEIGASIARLLHKNGANVVISGTRENALQQLQAQLKDRVHSFPCALNQDNNIYELLEKLKQQKINIDILVNNAGIVADNLIVRMSEQDFDKVIQVNLKAPFILIKNLLKNMMKNRWGRIINISSIVGVTGNPGQANYCASKAGIIGMSKAIALEVAKRNITVNCVSPGFIKTAMTENIGIDREEQLLKGIPQNRMGLPDDIANAVMFLASNNASSITGQNIHVNGGMTMI